MVLAETSPNKVQCFAKNILMFSRDVV